MSKDRQPKVANDTIMLQTQQPKVAYNLTISLGMVISGLLMCNNISRIRNAIYEYNWQSEDFYHANAAYLSEILRSISICILLDIFFKCKMPPSIAYGTSFINIVIYILVSNYRYVIPTPVTIDIIYDSDFVDYNIMLLMAQLQTYYIAYFAFVLLNTAISIYENCIYSTRSTQAEDDIIPNMI
jgi:hypothetical protein